MLWTTTKRIKWFKIKYIYKIKWECVEFDIEGNISNMLIPRDVQLELAFSDQTHEIEKQYKLS